MAKTKQKILVEEEKKETDDFEIGWMTIAMEKQ